TSRTETRLAILAGLSTDPMQAQQRWRQVRLYLPPGASADIIEAIFGIAETKLVVAESCQAALMFGSVAPTIDGDDASVLLGKLVALYHKEGGPPALRKLVHEEPLDSSQESAWKQGYGLAEELLDALALPDQ